MTTIGTTLSAHKLKRRLDVLREEGNQLFIMNSSKRAREIATSGLTLVISSLPLKETVAVGLIRNNSVERELSMKVIEMNSVGLDKEDLIEREIPAVRNKQKTHMVTVICLKDLEVQLTDKLLHLLEMKNFGLTTSQWPGRLPLIMAIQISCILIKSEEIKKRKTQTGSKTKTLQAVLKTLVEEHAANTPNVNGADSRLHPKPKLLPKVEKVLKVLYLRMQMRKKTMKPHPKKKKKISISDSLKLQLTLLLKLKNGKKER